MARASTEFISRKFPKFPNYTTGIRVSQTVNTEKKLYKKKLKNKLVQEYQKMKLHYSSNGTEDGVETESDFRQSSSYSEAGLEGDVEDFTPWHREIMPLRKKTSSSQTACVSSEEENSRQVNDEVFALPTLNLSDTFPSQCREGVLEEMFHFLPEFRVHRSRIEQDQFDDKGTLGDVEDCEETGASDEEPVTRRGPWRYMSRIWDSDSQ